MNLRTLLSFSLVLSFSPGVAGQSIDFPHPPPGQVLDTGGWLGDERKARLESELSRHRKSHGLDVLVILWDRGLPPETTLEELAERVGETWTRESSWVVVLHVPDSLLRPAAVFGGEARARHAGEEAGLALYNALSRAMKERTTRARVEALGLELAEEFVFLRNRATYERKRIASIHQEQLRDRAESHHSMIFRAVMATLLALLAVGVVGVIYLLKRRPSNLHFPETHWRRRLGASWSGGGQIVVSLPPRVS